LLLNEYLAKVLCCFPVEDTFIQGQPPMLIKVS
jgi:hypothetical protein